MKASALVVLLSLFGLLIVNAAKEPESTSMEPVSDEPGDSDNDSGADVLNTNRVARSVETKEPSAMGIEMVNFIKNNHDIPFLARSYPQFENKTKSQLKSFLGLLSDPNIEAAKKAARSSNRVARSTLPTKFMVATNWKKCKKVVNTIQNQRDCGSCWAVSVASVIQDRRCIEYNKPQLPISSWDLVSCCADCQGTIGNGCEGGYPTEAFNYYINSGVVTGGKYGKGGCKPYKIGPSVSQPSTTSCSKKCQKSYKAHKYPKDKHFGNTYQVFSNDTTSVMEEIMARGSVIATYAVYMDFYQYSSGVYQYTTGELVGYHAVRIVGWGTNSDGIDYWKVANSWGKNWGVNGFFYIVRGGTDKCGFEEGVVSGTAKKD